MRENVSLVPYIVKLAPHTFVSSAGKWGLAQGWLPLQKQDRRLLRLLERGPERRLFRVQGQTLLRTPAREPLRQQGRWLFRNEDRVRFRAQLLNRNRVLLGYECRRPVRGPSMGSEL